MNFANPVCEILQEEHRATVALMERLDRFLARHRDAPPGIDDGVMRPLLSDLIAGVEGEIRRHFAFEEEHLFPHLEAIGEAAIGAHLTDEHRAIQPIGAAIARLARTAMDGGFTDTVWREFRRLGLEFSDRLSAHAQKEDMALLPLLDETMDPDAAARLVQQYRESA
jgi:hemerythrin-like domain-containing protein